MPPLSAGGRGRGAPGTSGARQAARGAHIVLDALVLGVRARQEHGAERERALRAGARQAVRAGRAAHLARVLHHDAHVLACAARPRSGCTPPAPPSRPCLSRAERVHRASGRNGLPACRCAVTDQVTLRAMASRTGTRALAPHAGARRSARAPAAAARTVQRGVARRGPSGTRRVRHTQGRVPGCPRARTDQAAAQKVLGLGRPGLAGVQLLRAARRARRAGGRHAARQPRRLDAGEQHAPLRACARGAG